MKHPESLAIPLLIACLALVAGCTARPATTGSTHRLSGPPSIARGPEGGTVEWLRYIGAQPVPSVSAAASSVGFPIRLPDALGGTDRTALSVVKSRAGRMLPPKERELYALYGDVGVFEGAGPPNTTARQYAASTSPREGVVLVKVNGYEAAASTMGTYASSTGVGTVVNTGSKVVWLQDGVVHSVTSSHATARDLLPLAEVVSRQAIAH